MSKIFKNLFTGPNEPNTKDNVKNNSKANSNSNESISSKKLTFITNAQTLKDEDINKLEKTFENYKKKLDIEKRKNKELKSGVDVSVNVLIDMNQYLEKQKLFQDKIIALSKKYNVDGNDNFLRTNIDETNRKLEELKETMMNISRKYDKSLTSETRSSLSKFLSPTSLTSRTSSKIESLFRRGGNKKQTKKNNKKDKK